MNDKTNKAVQPGRRIRRFLLATVFLLLTVLVAVAVAATNAEVMGFVVYRVLQRTIKTVEVRDVRLGSLAYSFPSSWTAGNVRVTVLSKGKLAGLFIARMEIKDAFCLLAYGKKMTVSLRGVQAAYDQLKVSGASCDTDLNRSPGGVLYQGRFFLEQVSSDPLRVSEVKVEFAGDKRSVKLSNMAAVVYGGRLSGRAHAVFNIPADYDVNVMLQEVDTGELERALGGFFRELSGKLSGRLHVAGTGEFIDVFDTSWTMPSGGAVSAELLASITRYIPDSAQKKRIDALIRSGGKLAVESFLFTLKNDSPEQLSGQISIKSREANLELNVDHETKVDARIDSLLQALRAIFK